MSTITNYLNAAGNDYLRILFIFVLVLIAVFFLFYFIRLIIRSMKRGVLGGKRSRQPRLGFIEEAEIDARRRLILIRRDNVEHLILLGPTHDLVVESNIMKAFDGQKATPPASRDYPQPPFEEEGKAYVPTAKNTARKAAGEVTVQPPRAPSPQTKSAFEQPPTAPEPTVQETPIMQAPPARLAPLERPVSSQTRYTPISFSPKPLEPLPVKTLEQEIIALNAPQASKKISFDSLEDEMAALLGQKKV